MEITLGKGMVFIGALQKEQADGSYRYGLTFSPRNKKYPSGTLDPKGPFYKGKKDITIWVDTLESAYILDEQVQKIKLLLKNYSIHTLDPKMRKYLEEWEPKRKS